MKQIDAERGTVTFSVIQGYRMRNRLKQYGFRVPAGKKCLHGSSEKMRRADQADCGRSPRIGVQGFWTDWSAGLSRVKFQATSQPQVQRDTERWLIHSNLHHYRNREGEYQVIDIHGDEMTIRYTSGKTIRTDISTQQRILDNLEIEDDIAEDERLRSQHDKHVLRDGGRTGGHNPKFDGFSAADFGSPKDPHGEVVMIGRCLRTIYELKLAYRFNLGLYGGVWNYISLAPTNMTLTRHCPARSFLCTRMMTLPLATTLRRLRDKAADRIQWIDIDTGRTATD
ncbi:MAG: hypothetical protein R2854_13970 [Caldilineaceae bacterium]